MATSFKGIYNAFDFAYGVNGAASGALQVTEGSNASGTYTVKCSPAVLQSADGKPITVSTTTPISIGAGAGWETVTPTAVSTDSSGRLLITAAFANAHGAGAQIRSGSAGVVEAMNYVHSIGGGLVAIDGVATAALGGATAMRTAIHTYAGWANVTVLDYSGPNNTTASVAHSYYAAPVTAPANGGVLTSSGVTLY
jgi:hypothetical protein